MVDTTPPLVIATPTLQPIQELTAYTLDLAYGDSENDFQLTTGTRIPPGSLIWMDGTPYGGIIDSEQTTATTAITYSGRTWHGILNTRIIQPPQGQDHYTASGDLNTILRSLVADAGLDGLFDVDAADSGISAPSVSFDRYVTLLAGFGGLLADHGAKLCILCADNKVRLSVRRAMQVSADSEHVSFTVRRDHHPVNHLIALGKGEMAAREVVHRYADRDGTISSTQSLFGLDEVQATYELSNASGSELSAGADKRLGELLAGLSSADIDIHGGIDSIDVGDMVTASDALTGIQSTVRAVKKIVKVSSSGTLTVSVDVGDPSGTSNPTASGTGQSSASTGTTVGRYVAGRGIMIAGTTISAEVAASDLRDLKGEKGDPGTAATVSVERTVTGEPGSEAKVANVGTGSSARLEFSIPRGRDGEAATVTIGKVITGMPGSQASVTDTGTPGHAVLEFTIPRGDKGETGDMANLTTGDLFSMAHPVGCLYRSATPTDPAIFAPGTTWQPRETLDGFLYERTS